MSITPKVGAEAYAGTPTKKRAQTTQSANSALPTTPARSDSHTSRSTSHVSSTGTALMTQRQATQMSTPIPQQKSVNVTARTDSKQEVFVESDINASVTDNSLDSSEYEQFEEQEDGNDFYDEEDVNQEDVEGDDRAQEVVEVIEIEPSDLIRAENEDWKSWEHEALAEHAGQVNLALLQLAEDILQWRVHCASLNRNGKEMYEQYVQQCHRLQRMSAQYKACKREFAEANAKLALNTNRENAAEQRLQQQQERFKSNIEACQMLKDSLSAANKRIKELEEAKTSSTASAEMALAQRETALSNALQLAESLSHSLEESKSQVSALLDEKEALENELERTRAAADSNKRALMAKVEQLQRENVEYSKQIDSLAETPEALSKPTETLPSTSSSSRSSVPETPSKRSLASGSSPQKRVEALSIRVETLRAHNANLEEQIARQEISMKMQLEEAAQNEMKWKAVAKEVQNDLDEALSDLNDERAENEAIKRELAQVELALDKSAVELKRLESREASLVELKAEMKNMKEIAAKDEEKRREQEEKIERAEAAEFELAEALAELDSTRAALKQAEDDMRLLYLQHKSDKAELEATYRHEDYKSKYAQAVSKSSILHQKLSHVLQFIASNATLVKLAGHTEDRSLEEALNGWNTYASLDIAVIPSTQQNTLSSASSVSTPSKSTASTPVRRVRKSIIASSSPMRSKGVPASPAMESHKRSSRRTSMAGRRTSMVATQPTTSSSSDVELLNTDFSVMTQQQMTSSIIEACKTWRSKAQALANRVALMEKLVLNERQSKLEEIRQLSQDHAEQLQTHMDALQISHDAHAGHLEAEIESQRSTLEGQTEAFRSLHSAYLFMCEQAEILKIRLHEATCDLITYKATYDEAKLVTQELFDSEKQILTESLSSMELEFSQTKEAFEAKIAQIQEELEARDETINFLENEGEAAREAEAEARKNLVEQHNTHVTELELQVETQQHHIESQEANIELFSTQLQEAQQQLQFLQEIIQQRDLALVATTLALQHIDQDRSALLQDFNDSRTEIITANEHNITLEEQLEMAEMLLGRAKGALMAQTAQGVAMKRRIESQVIQASQLHQSILEYESKLQLVIKEKQEELTAKVETSMKLQQLESDFASQKACLEAELTNLRAELVQTTTDHRIALVSTESRLEETALELAELQTSLSAAQDECDRVKSSLDEEIERAESLEAKFEDASRQLEAKAMECEDLLQRLELAHNDASTSQQHCDEISAQLEATKQELVSYMTKIGVTENELESVREKWSLEAGERHREIDRLTSEIDHKNGELEMVSAELERVTKEREALKENVAGFESSRNQLEQVVKSLEIAQEELQSTNTSLEKQLAIERDEKERLCEKISNMQTSLADQMLQAQSQHEIQQQQLQQQQEQLASLSSSQALIKNNQENEEISRLAKEHDLWLDQLKQALLEASKAYLDDIVTKKSELELEGAALRARITTLENLVQEMEENKDSLEEQIRYHINDLSIAKLSHRLLLLQNGNLANVIEMQGVAMAKISSGNNKSPSSTTVSSSDQAVMAVVAPDMKNMMKLQRQAQSLVLKQQQLEEENRQLKNRLNECKLQMYEKEDLWLAQIRSTKQRFGKSEEQCKLAEQTKLQLFTFLGQVREILVRNAHVPSIRELLVHWAPIMNSLVVSGFSAQQQQQSGSTSSSSGAVALSNSN